MHWDISSSVTSEARIPSSRSQTTMWRKRVFLLLFSLSTLKAELNSEQMEKTNKLTSPILNSETNIVMKGQNVSIICSSQSKLSPITYSLFRDKNCIGTQDSKGEHVTFNLRISEASDLGPYKCKAQVPSCIRPNCTRYSHEFNFTLVDPVTTPVLNITRKASHYVTLHCISFNGSLPINYTFFENNITISRVIIKNVREPAELNLTKNPVGVEKYKCKAENRLPRHVKYSSAITITSKGEGSCPFCLQLLLPVSLLVLFVTILILAFWTLSKYKARKARRDKAPKDYGNTPMEVGLYANVCENPGDKESAPGLERRQCVSTAQDETKSSQEIHYATPLFQKVTPQNHEACNKGKTEYIYSEIIL
ncbi:allergin-1 [Phyllostomus discolor]|uniref:Allergin-1 n=1 Tax=Phyllostomus discolor TaxID=89673 RepID=A0A6J2MCP6_9CHIR|nr:allergin-1 [Phyllostomus discolor]